MKSFLMAFAAAAAICGMGMSDRAIAADGYFYAAPSYYVAPPAYLYPPTVFVAPAPVFVPAAPVYAAPPAYYYPPAVAYYPPPAYARSIYARPGKIKVKEYTPWGKRKYEWEYSRHGYWKLDD